MHAMNSLFEEESTDAILLVDASNAFNVVNCKVLLHNIGYICPPMAIYVHNCYQKSTRLFVLGGKEIKSDEGTTQGDPMAMPIYAIGITPLLDMIKDDTSRSVTHVAFADDLAGAGSLECLRKWWDNINKLGPLIGYYPKETKSWIVVKADKIEKAGDIFNGIKINITSEGHKYLGGVIGKAKYKATYTQTLVSDWVNQIKLMSEIAKSEPQAVYSAFTGGFISKFTYHLRVINDIKD